MGNHHRKVHGRVSNKIPKNSIVQASRFGLENHFCFEVMQRQFEARRILMRIVKPLDSRVKHRQLLLNTGANRTKKGPRSISDLLNPLFLRMELQMAPDLSPTSKPFISARNGLA